MIREENGLDERVADSILPGTENEDCPGAWTGPPRCLDRTRGAAHRVLFRLLFPRFYRELRGKIEAMALTGTGSAAELGSYRRS